MQREECIYNLIPRIVIEPEKPERYKSKHDPKTAPTGTTFGVHGKTRLEGANLGAKTTPDMPASARGFGRVTYKADPKTFTKKGERCTTIVDPAKRRTCSLFMLVAY